MKIEQLPIDAVEPYGNNPRNNARSISKIAKSIARFGFRQPIVIDEDNVILAGHGRWLAARSLGLMTVPVHRAIGLSMADRMAYRIADNRTGELSSWDRPRLSDELTKLKQFELDLGYTGFDGEALNRAEIIDYDLGSMAPGDKPQTAAPTSRCPKCGYEW
jgi:ParB-like chromosome segregation protein Spo0J